MLSSGSSRQSILICYWPCCHFSNTRHNSWRLCCHQQFHRKCCWGHMTVSSRPADIRHIMVWICMYTLIIVPLWLKPRVTLSSCSYEEQAMHAKTKAVSSHPHQQPLNTQIYMLGIPIAARVNELKGVKAFQEFFFILRGHQRIRCTTSFTTYRCTSLAKKQN